MNDILNFFAIGYVHQKFHLQNNHNYNPSSEKEFNSTNLNEIEDGEIPNDNLITPTKVINIYKLINMKT